MADTVLASFDRPCSDCGTRAGVVYKHWGQFVPAGKIGFFCFDCFEARKSYFDQHGSPKPITAGDEK